VTTVGFVGLPSNQDIPGLVNIPKATLKMATEIVDLPIKNGDFP
jgi:hypothetical protein